MHVNVDTDKIKIDIPGADELIEPIDKTAYGKINSNRIKLKSDGSNINTMYY
jgi:hypothetical protein